MRYKNLCFAILPVILSLILLGCGDSPVKSVEVPESLIANPSFEEKSAGSLTGWTMLPPEASYYSFAKDVPSNGGEYSLAIKESWGTANKVYTSVVLPAENSSFKFTCWAKVENKNCQIWIGIQKADTLLKQVQFTVNQTVWTKYTSNFNYIPSAGDTLKVFLEGSSSSIQASKSFFDLCTIEVIQ